MYMYGSARLDFFICNVHILIVIQHSIVIKSAINVYINNSCNMKNVAELFRMIKLAYLSISTNSIFHLHFNKI